eukprot:GHVT01080196.1.p1 GENE.GHVT01080196.1~~GHVT01080196.1.p1  ORF type:complete len:439 (-),score=59.41 GHVT01080196.1:417-1733(-)
MTSDAGDLQLLIPGRKVLAIYGFARICDFEDITDCLQEEVMVFVNKVARLVHTCVNECRGSANKNIGDSFLLVWVANDGASKQTKKQMTASAVPLGTAGRSPSMQYRRSKLPSIGRNSIARSANENQAALQRRVRDLSTRALYAFIKVIAELRRAPDLATYAKHPKIIPTFGMKYKLKMRIGIHCGWSIEGSIGSEYKIDASYLSSHVNLAARLQAATNIYGSSILLSQAVHISLGRVAQSKCRPIDVVQLYGCHAPVGIFAFDVDPNGTACEVTDEHSVGEPVPPEGMTLSALLSHSPDQIIELDQDVKSLQGIFASPSHSPPSPAPPSFSPYSSHSSDSHSEVNYQLEWRPAFEAYRDGQWAVAEAQLRRCLARCPHDGAATSLLSYITANSIKKPRPSEDRDGQPDQTIQPSADNIQEILPPADWMGFRKLTVKT